MNKCKVKYKICGKEHQTIVNENDKLEAIKKINASLQIISCEPEENDMMKDFFDLLGINKKL